MEKPLYAVCPYCGQKAKIQKYIWNWEEDQTIALIKCDRCGKSQVPYSESRIIDIDLQNPYMQEEHFRLLIPAGWNHDMWNRFSQCLKRW